MACRCHSHRLILARPIHWSFEMSASCTDLPWPLPILLMAAVAVGTPTWWANGLAPSPTTLPFLGMISPRRISPCLPKPHPRLPGRVYPRRQPGAAAGCALAPIASVKQTLFCPGGRFDRRLSNLRAFTTVSPPPVTVDGPLKTPSRLGVERRHSRSPLLSGKNLLHSLPVETQCLPAAIQHAVCRLVARWPLPHLPCRPCCCTGLPDADGDAGQPWPWPVWLSRQGCRGVIQCFLLGMFAVTHDR